MKGELPLPLLALLHPNADTGNVVVRVFREGSLSRGRRLDLAVEDRADDAVLVVLAPALRRAGIAGHLRRRGFRVLPVLSRGSNGATQLLSLDRTALRFALEVAPARTPVRRLVATLLSRRVARLLCPLLPRVLLVAYAPPAPPAHWLGSVPGGHDASAAPFVLSLTPSRERGYVYRFATGRDAPVLIAKVGLTTGGARRVEREGRALNDVAPTARAAGLDVPELFHTTRIGGTPVLLESFVRGASAARLIAARPERMEAVVRQLTNWLARWGAATSVSAPVSSELVETSLLRPAAGLAGVVPSALTESIRAEAAQLLRRPALTTAAHNDLTMWNVLVSADGTLGVLDWENAAGRALPLTDLFYALVDAVAATRAYVDRRAAFHDCFHLDGARSAWARSIAGAQARALGVSPDFIAVSFGSCWLQHGADEARRGTEQGFLAMLGDLAEAPESYWPMIRRVD